MVIEEYKPNMYNKLYHEIKIALRLCFDKKLSNNIIYIIEPFLATYNTNFALFINNSSGHPYDYILRILSSFNNETSNIEFNQTP